MADFNIMQDVIKKVRLDDETAKKAPARQGQPAQNTEDSEVVSDIVEQAKRVQRVAEKIYFLSVLKRFGLAFGGILLLLGAISATAFFLLILGVFPSGLKGNMDLLLKIGLALFAAIQILAGLALLAG